ncbi:MAG: ArnT family glycosyltransferase [Fusobacteriaceae bacterium]
MFQNNKKLYLVILSFISFFSTIWVRKADLMESRNFITAREIVKNNEWIVTTLNGNYRFEKPPLPTWFTAITMKITGNFSDEWLLRIPVALTSVLLIYFIYKLVKELSKDDTLAFLSAFIATTTFMLTKVGAENAWDSYPYIFMVGSIAFLLKSIGTKGYFDIIVAGILLAFSLLSKGPVSIYGMFLPFAISYIVAYGTKNIVKNKKKISLYFIIGLLLASIWPIAMIIENKELFLSVMNKEKNTWSNNHVKSFFFYFNYFLFMGVWIFFSIFTFFKKWTFHNKNENRFFKFGVLWSILTFLLISFIKMKKERYGFPLYIVSTLPIGVVLNYYLKNDWNILNKYDKFLFYIQAIFISTVAIGSIGIILWKKQNLFYLALPFLVILIYILKSSLSDKNIFKKNIVYISGLLLIIVNSNLTWIIEKEFRSKKDISIQNLDILQKTDLKYKIYSEDFSIENVWSVGQNILPLTENTILEDEFYILSKKNELTVKDFYKIEFKNSYTEFDDSNKLVYLYKISKQK